MVEVQAVGMCVCVATVRRRHVCSMEEIRAARTTTILPNLILFKSEQEAESRNIHPSTMPKKDSSAQRTVTRAEEHRASQRRRVYLYRWLGLRELKEGKDGGDGHACWYLLRD